MRSILYFTFLLVFTVSGNIYGQEKLETLEELRALQSDKISKMADLQAQINALQGEVDLYQDNIDVLAGWKTGVNGILGFNLNKSYGWVANPNPRAATTGLNIGLTGFANYNKDNWFLNNKGIITESWQDVDRSNADTATNNDGLFDNALVDLFNLSALGGYKISETFGISAQAELNTSLLKNFLSPGTFDAGLGVTWLPSRNLSVMVHPLNFHYAFSGISGLSNEGAIGAKVRVDYYNDFRVYGKKVNWSSTLTSFIPYGKGDVQIVLFNPEEPDGASFEAGLFEYTWLNTLSFEVWKGIGVGFAFGLRKSDFEGEKLSVDELSALGCEACLSSSPKIQSYLNFGLTYNF